MSDDLKKLQDALKAGTPAPDPQNRARTIAQAEEIFKSAQGSENEPRPMTNRPQNEGVLERIKLMLNGISGRQALLATSSLAVLAMALMVTTQMNVNDTYSLPEAADLRADGLAGETPSTLSPDVQMSEMEKSSGPTNSVAPVAVDSAPMVEIVPEHTLSQLQARTRAMDMGTPPTLEPIENTLPLPADQFPKIAPNGLKITQDEPVSTFSIDVDTTSYALGRMAILDGYPIPPEAVRVEEMINYFDYDYATPESLEVPFETSISVNETPWNPNTLLMQIGIQGYDVAKTDRPPMGLVFLIDTSGSMEDQMKLPLLRKSFELLLNTLQEDDTVAIVTYAGSAGLALEPTQASDRTAILTALDQLSAGGSTAGQAGLQQAYAVAEEMKKTGQEARIILATDGDFNVGISNPDALKDYVSEKRENGVFLSVLGFGRGNYTDTIMQSIAQNGNGFAAYIDSLAEAQKVLVEEVTGSLMTIASDVKIQVEFNPDQISEYRLIGYETRALNREDFNDDRVDAGEIGAGHTVTAIYEITPKGSSAELTDDLRYSPKTAGTLEPVTNELAYVKLRYKKPGASQSSLLEAPVTRNTDQIRQTEANFAASVAAAGQLMRGSDLGGYTLKDAQTLASQNKGDDPFGYRSEFVKLLGLIPE